LAIWGTSTSAIEPKIASADSSGDIRTAMGPATLRDLSDRIIG
jgi:hypothetical protein